nr:zinc transporter ZIP11 isoform X3 [Anser cygnoides]
MEEERSRRRPRGVAAGPAAVSMLPGQGPVLQAVLGTLLTWGLTAAGSALVFVFSSGQRRILDGSLGFAAGGFSGPPHAAFALSYDPRAAKEKYEHDPASRPDYESELSIRIGRAGHHPDKGENGEPYQRRKGAGSSLPDGPPPFPVPKDSAPTGSSSSSWRRILLMILAITIHNIPEGLAVGVGFGAVGKSASATFQSARNLAIGIGIQNFPEGLAVSLPLRGAGFSTWKAFWYGQLSGMVEPLAGVFGAFAVVVAEPLLPYALGFAAGAMVYVVMDDIIPEAQTSGNGKLASWTSVLGFVVMMSLDVGLG